MAGATELNSAASTPTIFRSQMDGLATAVVYALCFAWTHLTFGVGVGVEFISATVLALFFAGLVMVPLLVCLPVVPMRRMLNEALDKQSSIAAFVPLAGFALYALQVILVWVLTRETYIWVLSGTGSGAGPAA